MATIGGRVVLDAELLEEAEDGIRAYRGLWLEQGRGYELRAVSGWFTVGCGGDHYFSRRSATNATASLRGKQTRMALEALAGSD
ncbi:hypothetical protein [Verrucomicrobium sp. 3C]|uniref:hypothetical protein n=1 Tax=Verrucomicrobium sp. 3C TaxID=1134055 RepID=UPI0012DEFF30|nr:hypothetical protein [Verrucomicrobium sp. 3C]